MLPQRFRKGIHTSSPQKNGLTGGTDLNKREEGNKLAATWLTKEQFGRLEEFLDKFSTGESFSHRFREFLVWTINQKDGINQAVIAQRFEEVT